MKLRAFLFIFLALAAAADVSCRAAAAADVLCSSAAQDAARSAGQTATVTLTASFAAGSCQCSFLPRPGANITCCTDETWAPAATEGAGTCACAFAAHQTIPANTFDFYACADAALQ